MNEVPRFAKMVRLLFSKFWPSKLAGFEAETSLSCAGDSAVWLPRNVSKVICFAGTEFKCMPALSEKESLLAHGLVAL